LKKRKKKRPLLLAAKKFPSRIRRVVRATADGVNAGILILGGVLTLVARGDATRLNRRTHHQG
jgi:hypothetical protein